MHRSQSRPRPGAACAPREHTTHHAPRTLPLARLPAARLLGGAARAATFTLTSAAGTTAGTCDSDCTHRSPLALSLSLWLLLWAALCLLPGAARAATVITIAEARIDQDNDYVPDQLGQTVKVRGVVTSVDFRGGNGLEVYIQDSTAGIDVFNVSINTPLNIDDNVEVTGAITQFNGLTQITPAAASDITVLSPGTVSSLPLQVVTLSQLGGGGGEAYEGELIRINNVTLSAPPATFAANTNYAIIDSTGSGIMRIDGDTNIDGTAPPGGTFSVIGVLGQFDNASPFDSGYQLFPRTRATDFLPAVPSPSSINATAGTPQSAPVNTAFATQFQATVEDSGNAPIEGAGVTFSAPSNGASGTFADGSTTITVATNASGVATAPVFTANAVVGSYSVVTSTGAGPLTANFALTNCGADPVVTNTGDSGAGSLRDAITNACPNSAITFSNTTAGGAVNFYDSNPHTIQLTSGELTIAESTTITGPGASVLTISGNNASRIFDVNTAGVSLSLSGLTLTNGLAPASQDGGAVRSNTATSTLTIDACVISNSTQPTAGFFGGGVLSVGPLTITNSTISGNTSAGPGGGLLATSTCNITNSTISDNTSDSSGGGINATDTCTITNSTISGNQGTHGGGIATAGASLTITGSTISGNTATTQCGGINIQANGVAGTTASLTNCTITGNTDNTTGDGGILNLATTQSGTLTLRHCTISGNTSIGAQVVNFAAGAGNATLNVGNCLFNGTTLSLANGTASTGTATITSDGFNLSSDGADDGGGGTFLNQATDQLNVANPGLGPLADNGGPTQTMALQSGSPALDQGSNFGVATDQRGQARPFNDPAIAPAGGGDNSDIGAFEANDVLQGGPSFEVNTIADTDDGSCGTNCTLREAINAANGIANTDPLTPDIITFNATVFTPAQTITLGGTQLTPIIDDLTITGPAAGVTLDANDLSGVFEIDPVVVNLFNLTVANGNDDGNIGGGGILNTAGILSLTDCTLAGNHADGSGFGGGAMLNGGGLVTLTNCTLAANHTDDSGGAGIANWFGGEVTLINCTLSGNHADDLGGGSAGGAIFQDSGTVTLSHCTLAGNHADSTGLGAGGGGIFNEAGGVVNLDHTIVANNTAAATDGPDGFGDFTGLGYNLIGDTTDATIVGTTGDHLDVDPKLNPAGLQNNGGPTQTIAPLPGSPAIDAGDLAFGGTPATDQRGSGFARQADGGSGGARIDIGAFEVQNYVVTTSADDAGVCDASCSLREAIVLANGTGTNRISFAIGSGVQTISPASALPPLTAAVTVDGTSQPGAAALPRITVNGTGVGAGVDGLTFNISNSVLRGLAIQNFGGRGVVVNGSNNVVGLDVNGSGAANKIWNNSGAGIAVLGAANHGNVLRGNSLRGNALPIDLNGDGLTANDANDGDGDPNGKQNFPVLTSALLGFNKTNTMLSGTLNSKASRSYRLDFYRGSTTAGVSDPNSTGTFYLGSLLVSTDGSGNLASPFSFNAGAPLSGVNYAVTATDVSTGDTSEFSALFFQDGVKPSISITAPNPAGGALTVGANFPQIQGTATDNLPGVTVRLQLLRLSDGMWWDGTNQNWVPTQTAQTILPTSTPGAAPGNWHSTGNLPKPSPTNPVTLRDDKYQIVAYAINAAGNQLVTSKTLSYDLHLPTVSISTPGTAGQASNSLVNVTSLSTVSGTSAHPGVGMKKVLLKLTRNGDNFQWNGSAWVASSPVVYLATAPAALAGASPAAWSKTSGFPTVGASLTNQLQVGKVYNLSAVSYDRLDQASAAFLLRFKVVSSRSVFTLPPPVSQAAPEPSE